MEIEFDPDKDAANIVKHGLSLADAGMIDLPHAAVIVDERTDYGEVRYRAFGRIEDEGYCLAFTLAVKCCDRSVFAAPMRRR